MALHETEEELRKQKSTSQVTRGVDRRGTSGVDRRVTSGVDRCVTMVINGIS